MRFQNPNARLFVPDGAEEAAALLRTTDLCIAAHPDDIEFMAYNGIADCFAKRDRWFSGLVLTDGAGSPRSGEYANCTDKEMKDIRAREQEAAAMAGQYSAVLQLGYTSAQVKNGAFAVPAKELAQLLLAMKPDVVYTHNLADRHSTHLAVSLRVIGALRSLRGEYRPRKLYGMEVWRSLDWLSDADKAVFDASAHPNIAASLSACFDSQISGGKRYDLAVLGRRAANATFGESHAADTVSAAAYGMDMTELIDGDKTPGAFMREKTDAFACNIQRSIDALGTMADG